MNGFTLEKVLSRVLSWDHFVITYLRMICFYIIEIYNYADDNTPICTGYNYDEVKMDLLVAVDKVILWFNDNFMKFNPDKFQCIVFGNVANPGTVKINGTSMNVEESVKLLGLHIDNKFNFHKHVTHVRKPVDRCKYCVV